MNQTRILITDDHALLRSGLNAILSAECDFDVVGEAATGEEAIEQAVALKPDVVLLDIAMPGINGLDAARVISERVPAVRIVVLTMYDDEAYLQQFLEIGAMGYVLKKSAATEVVEAIRTVQRGESFIDPSLTRRFMELYRKQAHPQPAARADDAPDFSPRQLEVLRLVALGYTGRQIADQLCLSVSTVETHREHIMEKLGVRGRAQLVQYALRNGLLEEPGR